MTRWLTWKLQSFDFLLATPSHQATMLPQINFVPARLCPSIAFSKSACNFQCIFKFYHNVPKFENTLKMAGTFRKMPFKAVIWQAQN